MKCARQGDVLLIAVRRIPKDARPMARDPRGVVLMEGEHTGHHHRFSADSGVVLLERDNGERFGRPAAEAALVHEEHAPILWGTLFQQGFQVEDYGEEVRPVVD